jgi:hypothetical protein
VIAYAAIVLSHNSQPSCRDTLWGEAKHTGAPLMGLDASYRIEHNLRVERDVSVQDVLFVLLVGATPGH